MTLISSRAAVAGASSRAARRSISSRVFPMARGNAGSDAAEGAVFDGVHALRAQVRVTRTCARGSVPVLGAIVR